ncbi:Zinc carboxypeptidase [Variovorax sp. SRS16]|uniref:peptidase M14 n=1 Tax=Variovorax sp. SRS16 TaxID=282217 RepID=UPI001317D651|nr:peptidase M14 [Variovorax sp. SRS16]VTU20267.1 Zinc carboxypeptidase [Variovorax sp. SRS16]
MNVLLDTRLPRTLDAWVQSMLADGRPGLRIDAWLFEGLAARRAAEQRLAEAGIAARFRSAYKPLVHHFQEEVDLAGLASVTVHCPVHPMASARRFALEAYPLAEMLTGIELQLVPQPPSEATPRHEIELRWHDGRQRTDAVFAPNRVHQDVLGNTLLSPCAWMKITQGEAPVTDGARPSDYEALFRLAMDTLHQHPWPVTEPYFERLDIRVDLPGVAATAESGAPWVDLHEALHEDLYFSLLELFQQRSGRPPGDRRLQPGQIVPDVRVSEGKVGLRIGLREYPAPIADEGAANDIPLDRIAAPLGFARIAEELAAIPGERFEATSRQGRAVVGIYHPGAGPAVIVSGGQHANETSGVVGALRAARHLAAQPDAHFALIALENPDGYALHRELCAHSPQHMHHAARYTALGDDVEYREHAPFHEREARHEALRLSGAALHINLHGYAAHEWTRPLTGYIPRGFALWTMPKGFFLVLRYRKGWADTARRLAKHVCGRLAERPELMAFNAAQLATYNTHAGALPFEVIRGTACSLSEVDRPGPALTLITEFPDETIYGDSFVFAHDTQTAAVLAAVEAIGLISPSP